MIQTIRGTPWCLRGFVGSLKDNSMNYSKPMKPKNLNPAQLKDFEEARQSKHESNYIEPLLAMVCDLDGFLSEANEEVGKSKSSAYRLAMLSIQSGCYKHDPDLWEAVDDVLAWAMPRSRGELAQRADEITRNAKQLKKQLANLPELPPDTSSNSV